MSEELDLDQYEGIMARLEEIVKLLETGRAPLGESLRLYQEAKGLSLRANQLLARAEALMGDETTPRNAGGA
ncbi:MAG: exodeoxyribonuclease VII small subunit [Firmicutes bacterium]|nr:exodeoxyribonuclease VII small subunit [Bacillota bacterium]